MGKGAHVDISSRHLEFVHLAHLILEFGLVDDLFPIRIPVVVLGRVFEVEFHDVADCICVFYHFRNDFLLHLLVYLVSLLAVQQLHVDAVQLFAEVTVFVEQGQTGCQIGIEGDAVGMTVQNDGDADQCPLVDLRISMRVGIHQPR